MVNLNDYFPSETSLRAGFRVGGVFGMLPLPFVQRRNDYAYERFVIVVK